MQNTRPTLTRFYHRGPEGELVLLGSASSPPALKPDLRPVPRGRSLAKSLTFFFEIDDADLPGIWATFFPPEPARDLQKHDLVRDLLPLLPQWLDK